MIAYLSYFLVRPEVDILSPNKTEDDGNDVTFTCRAIGVPPVVSYKWFDSGGNEISIDQKFSITSSGNSESRLTITRVTSSDAGQYTCSASNRLGDGQGKSVFLTVNCKFCLISMVHSNPNKGMEIFFGRFSIRFYYVQCHFSCGHGQNWKPHATFCYRFCTQRNKNNA